MAAYDGEKNGSESEEVSLGMKVVLSSVRGKFSSVHHLSTSTLYQWLQNGDNSSNSQADSTDMKEIILLDTRPEEEYAVSHLAGALRVDPNTSDMGSLLRRLPQGQTVVCYCSLGYRSSQMAQRIQKYLKDNPDSGIKTVYNLEGSLFKWANEDRPMVDRTGSPTIYVHPYSAIWGRLLHKQLRRDKL